ncbi:MAG TPA: hypothetical protein VF950_17045 [Planctomycetota bacterium]
MRTLALALVAIAGCRAAAEPAPERVRYVRPDGALECVFELRDGSVFSVTGPLAVEAHYGSDGSLWEARAALKSGGTARVEVFGGRAAVERPGRPTETFDVPKHVIVTSAPDWTDAFLVCRRWTRGGPARQEFPGLWIHPVQPPQRLTFTAESQGVEGDLERLLIRLRGGSAYVAWTDRAGRMIKLAAKQGTAALSLEGVDTSALKP